ncbi:hypothetical protein FEM48_Zijuj01G0234400 [Ziziphus jujuba var. spinosa]|uniref:Uncharacterized protein n=1 Tax=Ziziphus jujuba var. spinosa TaxID=714518 RepID=A0A978W464_ZIZJJ|nr:hypothetical protein FEM48_Zijuj01G0234400 [Ziziphus jujuba var. spinosa]
MLVHPWKEHEVRKASSNDVGNSVEVEHGKKDRTNLEKIKEASEAANNRRSAYTVSCGIDILCGKCFCLLCWAEKHYHHVRLHVSVPNTVMFGHDGSKGEQIGFREKVGLQKEEREESVLDTCITQIKSIKERPMKMASKLLISEVSSFHAPVSVKMSNQCSERPTSADTPPLAVSSGVSTSLNPALDVTSESCNSLVVTSTDTVSSHGSDSYKTAKEFKLNPGAKIFSPSFTNTISATPAVPSVASMGYIPSTSPAVPVAAGQPEVGMGPFASHSSLPVKVVPYGNFTTGNGGTGSQFSQPVNTCGGTLNHFGATKTQPLRYAGQHPLQAGPAYVHPSSQALAPPFQVMVGGRLGQLVYLHPVSQELVQGVTGISPLSARPVMPPQQVPFPKHQGYSCDFFIEAFSFHNLEQELQLAKPCSYMYLHHWLAGGQQPFAMPYHIPILQPPFPNSRPTQVPGSNNTYGSKFS